MDTIFPKLEKKILKFWKESRVFERSVEKRRGAPNFVFYEGPPTANAKAGLHHVLARVYKDIVCRYKTMRGFRVVRKAGWDTHGLPVELEIEKKLGLKSKKDIEKYGIAKFNAKCKKSVWTYKKTWERLTERIAFWVDMEHPYVTYENDYIETLWWIIKQIYQKKLLYKDYKVVPYCPRCGTSLSSHEVALGYKKVQENSIYVKFRLKGQSNTYLLIWTTTPWTLPGNVAVAVNQKFIYVKVKFGEEYLILAEERLSVLGKDHEIAEEIKGKNLVGLEYEPLFPVKEVSSKMYSVVGANFVSLGEGTGLVHIAPAFGEDDMRVGKENNLPVLVTVDEEGRFKKDVKNWAGLWVKEADSLIIKNLEDRKLLFKEELYEHDYPFCWRCASPLLYYAKESWFINMRKVKENLIENNQKINWVPSHLKEGRFGEWLKELKDWAFSRERYWGTPIPIWKCEQCGELEVIGSKKDFLSQRFSGNNYYILRHGYSIRNQSNIASSWPEKSPGSLTKKGILQAQKAAKELKKKKIDVIFASDLLRTRQTAEIAAEATGAKIIFDSGIREVNVGVYNGHSIPEVQKAWGEPMERFKKKLPGGETYNDAKKRMYKFIQDIDKKYQGKNILIVSHECPLSLLECALKGFSDSEIVQYRGSEKPLETGQWRKIKFATLPYDQKMALDFHRPYIDEARFFCKKCRGLMSREKEVVDVWFDSGAMPFAQYHYPFENKNLINKNTANSKAGQFPADYISEAIDQTRGWFYTLLAVSTLLGFGPSYKNVISLGHVLDEKGEKMSKSKGNAVDPWHIIETYSADAVRWYFFTVNQPGDSKLFAEKDAAEALKKFIMTFWNSFIFYNTYAKTKRDARYYKTFRTLGLKTLRGLDAWIISRLHGLIRDVSNGLEKFDITSSARAIENFTVNDLSNWYIRRSRRKLQKPLNGKEFDDCSRVLGYILFELSLVTAPFIPFLSEQIYGSLIKSKTRLSAHLENWPEANQKLINPKLETNMEKTREIVAQALAQRAKAGIKVRQPLAKLTLRFRSGQETNKELLDLIKEEVNVKEVIFDGAMAAGLELDTAITPELEEEGLTREIIRSIQDMRKDAGLKPEDKILIQCFGSPELNQIMGKNKKFILEETKAKGFIVKEKSKKGFLAQKETKVGGGILWSAIKIA